MTFEVKLSAFAIEDLIALHQWIASSGDPATASGYIDRIEERIGTLGEFPNRGAPRDDLVQGLRTLSFEKRILIAYRVDEYEVVILRIIDGSRDISAIFSARS